MPDPAPRPLESIRFDIWRNLPRYPSTFGPCCRCGVGVGRGSGPCLACLQTELAGLVGAELAAQYVSVVGDLRSLERQIFEEASRRRKHDP